MEYTRVIECLCSCWEEMPADEPRDHSQHFQWVDNTDDEAHYICPECQEIVLSKTVEDNDAETEEENTCDWCGKPCEKDFCSERCATYWVSET